MLQNYCFVLRNTEIPVALTKSTTFLNICTETMSIESFYKSLDINDNHTLKWTHNYEYFTCGGTKRKVGVAVVALSSKHEDKHGAWEIYEGIFGQGRTSKQVSAPGLDGGVQIRHDRWIRLDGLKV